MAGHNRHTNLARSQHFPRLAKVALSYCRGHCYSINISVSHWPEPILSVVMIAAKVNPVIATHTVNS